MRRVTALVLLGVLAFPVASSALTADELRAQIAEVLAQLQTLQGQVKSVAASSTIYSTTASSTASAPAATRFCPGLRRALAFGSRGDDVSELQRYLVDKGYLAADSTTGYFGALTRAAVRSWQAAEGIASSGDESSTGWGAVGAKSRTAIARACGALSQTPVQLGTSGSQCVMPAFIEGPVPKGVPSGPWNVPLMSVDESLKGFTLSVMGLPTGLALRESTSTVQGVVKRNWSIAGTLPATGQFSIVAKAKNTCATVTRTYTVQVGTGTTTSTSSGGSGGTTNTTTSGVRCGTPTPIPCVGGSLDWLGNDSDGCSLGYRCTYTSPKQCTQYPQPNCDTGQHIQDGGYYDDGCAAPAICVAD